ncbi:PREDICTED: long-chain-fatty-acid--CoA ligase ACSBG2-like isoform X1 [Branchiostoma belcheri]|uniref:long-chain-fatty-acid--CoA ligase n=2 Tax=Branchiostoma belcheri TaxID=7741 RepID=A0A6P5AFL7_BRABE|nr:PREDICTED: long-chain-fatty-acid--CoA ligase ACSBG2-like isoform X1 [Branchiostoma belcheri]
MMQLLEVPGSAGYERLRDRPADMSVTADNHAPTHGNHTATSKGVNGTMNGVLKENGDVSAADIHVSLSQKGVTPAGLLSADSLMTWKADGAVQLRMSETGALSRPPETVHAMFTRAVKNYPDQTALGVKRNDVWLKWTYQEYYDACCKAAKSLIKLGLERFHGVGIIGFNSPEWFMGHLGAILAGGFGVGIYTTNNAEACRYVAESCEANVIIVENNVQLQKILKVWDKLPHLKAVVQYTGPLEQKRPNLYTWEEFMKLGSDVADKTLEDRISAQVPNQCCVLIYTSGTTGNPKGAMLSHDNITWTAHYASEYASLRMGKEISVSYLPLSHVAGQMLDIFAPMCNAGSTYFAQPDALKGSLVQTLKEVRPTALLGVPRVWEKIADKLQAIGRESRGMKKKIGTWAKGIGLAGNMNIMKGHSPPWGWTIANMVVFRNIRKALGLDRCRLQFSGAAPIAMETLQYFMSINIPLYELYGMSESTGPHTMALPHHFRLGSCGSEFPGATTVIKNADDEGIGEVCFYGRHVFMGYLKMEDKTREALDEEGLLHSGDLGKKDQEGYLYITGRIKELIITAGGENIPPVLIEDTVKEELPIISNAMLIGDKRKFLSCLLTPKVEMDAETGAPTDQLTQQAIDFCRKVGSQATKASEIAEGRDTLINEAIQAGVTRANKRAASRAQNIQKWLLLEQDFSIPGGELGPTLKLRRPIVNKMYADTIDKFYAEPAPTPGTTPMEETKVAR